VAPTVTTPSVPSGAYNRPSGARARASRAALARAPADAVQQPTAPANVLDRLCSSTPGTPRSGLVRLPNKRTPIRRGGASSLCSFLEDRKTARSTVRQDGSGSSPKVRRLDMRHPIGHMSRRGEPWAPGRTSQTSLFATDLSILAAVASFPGIFSEGRQRVQLAGVEFPADESVMRGALRPKSGVHTGEMGRAAAARSSRLKRRHRRRQHRPTSRKPETSCDGVVARLGSSKTRHGFAIRRFPGWADLLLPGRL
jgi:hypothetical protein